MTHKNWLNDMNNNAKIQNERIERLKAHLGCPEDPAELGAWVRAYIDPANVLPSLQDYEVVDAICSQILIFTNQEDNKVFAGSVALRAVAVEMARAVTGREID